MIEIYKTRSGGAGDSQSDTILMLTIVLSMMKNIVLGIVKMKALTETIRTQGVHLKRPIQLDNELAIHLSQQLLF